MRAACVHSDAHGCVTLQARRFWARTGLGTSCTLARAPQHARYTKTCAGVSCTLPTFRLCDGPGGSRRPWFESRAGRDRRPWVRACAFVFSSPLSHQNRFYSHRRPSTCFVPVVCTVSTGTQQRSNCEVYGSSPSTRARARARERADGRTDGRTDGRSRARARGAVD